MDRSSERVRGSLVVLILVAAIGIASGPAGATAEGVASPAQTQSHAWLSPDGGLQAQFDGGTGTLTVSSVVSHTVSYTARLPLVPKINPGYGSVSWSPDGSTLVVYEGVDVDPVSPLAWTLLFVNAASGQLIDMLSDPCHEAVSSSSWLSDGSALIETCTMPDGTPDGRFEISSSGSITTPTDGQVASAGLPHLGGPATPATSVIAQPSGPGAVTITAALPAADNAGADVTDDHGKLLGRLYGGPLVIDRLAALHTYAFTVTPRSWDGTRAISIVVTAKTSRQLETSTSLTAPLEALNGTRVSVKVRITRADNGHGLAHRAVVLRARLFGGHITVIAHGRTDNHGYLTAHYQQGDTLDLTAGSEGDPAIAGSTSTTQRVTAQVRTTISVKNQVAAHRIVLVTLRPARLALGLIVEQLGLPPHAIGFLGGCAGPPVRGSLACNLYPGKHYRLTPLGPVDPVTLFSDPDGPSVTITIPS